MPPTIQIAIDCAEPHPLAAFWAEVLGYEVEHHDEMIRGLLESGQVTPDEVVEVDGGLAFKVAGACKDPAGVGPRLLFQEVPEDKVVKNRVHLDIHVTVDDREAEVARLEALGATRLWDGEQGPFTWVTMADPEGNEFCVA
jgi:hypothetical protein